MKRFLVILAMLPAATVFAEDAPAPTNAEAQAAIGKLRDTSKGRDEAGWKAAIAEAAKCRHASVVFELSGFLKSDSEAQRVAAAEAIGTMVGQADAAKALVAAIAPNVARVATVEAILRGLGTLGDAAAVPTIKASALAWMCETNADRGRAINAAAEALGGIRSKASVEALIELKAKCSGGPGQPAAVRNAAATRVSASLTKLTGVASFPKGDLAKWWAGIAPKYRDDLTPVEGGVPLKGMKK
ncbi:MAG: hypothetical protein FD180_128 [Planctomycetota bacterium]|nr:MAG: hypothetical protein FD180_128 [Planctomycetota bacterium]